ncbi:hypothetical protein FKP32DRAFT_1560466, partial [Trametes sanguinea]
MEPFLLAALLMASVLHSLEAVSRTNLRFLLTTLQVMVFGCFAYCNASVHLTPVQSDIMNAIPSDIRTVLSRLQLEPDFLRYASC